MKRASNVWSYALAVALGILGALVLSHFAACEEDDSVCMFTGVSK